MPALRSLAFSSSQSFFSDSDGPTSMPSATLYFTTNNQPPPFPIPGLTSLVWNRFQACRRSIHAISSLTALELLHLDLFRDLEREHFATVLPCPSLARLSITCVLPTHVDLKAVVQWLAMGDINRINRDVNGDTSNRDRDGDETKTKAVHQDGGGRGSRLTHLRIEGCDSPLQSLSQLTSLTVLDLCNGALAPFGPLPPLPLLQRLDLSGNQFVFGSKVIASIPLLYPRLNDLDDNYPILQ